MHQIFCRALVAACILLATTGCTRRASAPIDASHPHRIISFAPSLTETVFALHAESLLVAVTDFCTWPEAVKKIPSVGAYLDPSYERILALHPDHVIMLREHGPVGSFLAKNGVAATQIPNDRLSEILASFVTVGKLCGKIREADSLVASVKREIVPDTLPEKARPRVLLIAGRDNPGSGSVTAVWAASSATFYAEIIAASGGRCAIADSVPRYPQLGIEGILSCNPDIIIDLSAASIEGFSEKTCVDDWNAIPAIRAVATHAVFAPEGSYMTMPGPRIGATIRTIRTIIENHRSNALPRT